MHHLTEEMKWFIGIIGGLMGAGITGLLTSAFWLGGKAESIRTHDKALIRIEAKLDTLQTTVNAATSDGRQALFFSTRNTSDIRDLFQHTGARRTRAPSLSDIVEEANGEPPSKKHDD